MNTVNDRNKHSIETDDLNILTDEAVVRMSREGSGYAYEILISKYKDLAKSIAHRYYINGGDNEDVVQEGMIGIFKAIRDYDLDGNVPFKSFATLCIERQIQTAVSGANREKHKILNESLPLYVGSHIGGSMDDEENSGGLSEIDFSELSISDAIYASKADEPEKLTLLKETFSELEEIKNEYLSGFEVEVFNGMIQGKTYKEIAEEINRPPKSVDNAIQRIKKKIGEAMEHKSPV